ncbi:aminotransferase class V-fold PLP-dependent enzyme [Alpinimonas psychrophila]|uniref:Kynureninase n=1 Tax=Alpinimonas psychrophila TaxID=748908 RepID=A0A7W3JUW7_9MICO|nr:aminotransferase class V-fold PLP-dependent enzyme [Alpinimonas psychrophila]MBA8829706.1 kynureninase [Alpinimonas psychrophila]
MNDLTPDATSTAQALFARAQKLDAADPLASYRSLFYGTDPATAANTQGMPIAYFDGNSLGRPALASFDRIEKFLRADWGTRLIRSWDEQWMELPLELGDALGAAALGAAPGQTFIGDSTSVLLYKLARAAVAPLSEDVERAKKAAHPIAAGRGGRTEIVVDSDNFPTDRYLLEGIAAERGMTLRWIDADTSAGVTPEQVAAALSEKTALVLLSHVAYRSGFMADGPGITKLVHDAGALILWDLSHSVGSVVVELDAWGADLAVGCGYKYLCGGPGSPAFGYVRADLQDTLEQPIQGWMGVADVFAMGPEYVAAAGIRRFITGTPPVIGMLALHDPIAMIAEVGIAAIRAKSIALTEFAIEVTDALLAPLGVTLATPREASQRGGHVTLNHPAMREVNAALWEVDVIPDYRDPHGLRIGLSPLTTSFTETHLGMLAVRDALLRLA